MRWQDVDLEAGVWRYHVTKVRVDHAVPLARQSVDILKHLSNLTGNLDYVFASPLAKSGCISETSGRKFLKGIGWNQQTTHGFRAIARTHLAESLKIDPNLIEQQMSHTVLGSLGRAYNRTLFLDERTAMMQAWANWLDEQRAVQ